MASPLNKKTLSYLAALARIQLTAKEQEKLFKDLQKILAYFKELQELDTKDVMPMTGGTLLRNAFREDAAGQNTNRKNGTEDFPKHRNGFLEIPSVFD